MDTTTQFLDTLVQDFVNWARDIEGCRAICLFGSAARTFRPADEYSDRDMLVYATDTDISPYLDWMRQYAPLWMRIKDNPNSNLRLIVYKGGKSVHLAVDSVDDLQQQVDSQELCFDLSRSYKILLDKDGLAAQLPQPQAPQHKPPTADEFRECIENFMYGTILIAKQLKRGNLWTVKWARSIEDQKFMLQMIEWHARTRHEGNTWHRGEFMREWVDVQTWQGLHSAFGHFDAEDSWRALFGLIALFRRLAQETAAHLAYDYPETLINEVVDYVEALHE